MVQTNFGRVAAAQIVPSTLVEELGALDAAIAATKALLAGLERMRDVKLGVLFAGAATGALEMASALYQYAHRARE